MDRNSVSLFENLNVDVSCPDLSPIVTSQDGLRPVCDQIGPNYPAAPSHSAQASFALCSLTSFGEFRVVSVKKTYPLEKGSVRAVTACLHLKLTHFMLPA